MANDLTKGPIPGHIIRLAVPIAIGMFFQTLYVLVDLYFVAQLGDSAVAGVGAAGNLQFVVMALTQVLGIGTMALIANAVGKKDRDDANLIFNQSLVLAALFGAITLVGGYSLLGTYMAGLGADQASIQAGSQYLRWFIPGLALQFAAVAMGSALRGTGIEKPTMIVQIVTVMLNIVLSPILITGWLTGRAMGTAGAGLASTISISIGVALMAWYFLRAEKYIGVRPPMLFPRVPAWRRILGIGLPPGGEFGLMFIYIGVIYWVTRGFGAEGQAGFGIGSRVMQAIFLPAMAVAFATAPVAGQNFGAGYHDRVRQTFRSAAGIGSAMMFILTLFCQWRPEVLVQGFTDDPDVVAVGGEFLRIVSWNFVASGLIFTSSGMFQALGNTLPALLASASRLVTFVIPAIWFTAAYPDFELRHLWFLSVATVGIQALFSLWLLRREVLQRLDHPTLEHPTTNSNNSPDEE